jgi:phenylpropionate dioxygenase-like ring-hydroxylating dioxygenase large terminal subunit
MYGIGISQGLSLQNVKIAGKNHTLFKTKSGTYSLVDSVCPHRGASLSNGKVIGERVKCPYHGWEFTTKGKLAKVPSCYTIPSEGDTNTYPVIESGGFLWNVKNDTNLPTQYCNELFDDNWIKVYGSKELDGNIYDWILNSTDISHINFVHDFADETNAIVKNTNVIATDKYVDCYATVQSKASSILTEYIQPRDGAPVHTRFVGPATSIIRIKLANAFEFITFSTLTPMDSTHTKMSWCFLYPNTPFTNNPLVYKRFDDRLYETVRQDEAIIKSVEWVPMLANAPCDKFQIEALKLLEK